MGIEEPSKYSRNMIHLPIDLLVSKITLYSYCFSGPCLSNPPPLASADSDSLDILLTNGPDGTHMGNFPL